MINFISGDLITVQRGIIGHQTNVLGVAGSGIVVNIKETFPGWFQEYKDLCERYKEQKDQLLGGVQYFCKGPDLYVCNMFAQFSIKPFNRNTDLKAFESCLINLEAKAREVNLPVYMSDLIACDRGGMDWDAEIYPLIEKIFEESSVPLFLVNYVVGGDVHA